MLNYDGVGITLDHAMQIAGLAAMATAASIPPSMPGAAASSGRTRRRRNRMVILPFF
jgi:hypothetical protein